MLAIQETEQGIDLAVVQAKVATIFSLDRRWAGIGFAAEEMQETYFKTNVVCWALFVVAKRVGAVRGVYSDVGLVVTTIKALRADVVADIIAQEYRSKFICRERCFNCHVLSPVSSV